MSIVDWQGLTLDKGVLREASPGDGRIVLWVSDGQEAGFRGWERISSVARAEIVVEQGISAIAATSIRARQRVRGLLGAMLQRFGQSAGDGMWKLPNGTIAEQWGERQTDLLLVWSNDQGAHLDETRIRSRWPASTRVQRIGDNLFVVSGIEPAAKPSAVEAAPFEQGCPHAQIERSLAAARAVGDRRAETAALTDLGIVHLREGDPRRSQERLEEALANARRLGDRAVEADVLNYLGMAARTAGQSQRSLEVLQEALRYARETGSRFTEKAALYQVGITHSFMNAPARALELFGEALAIARAMGDRKHIVELLWFMAIRHAELGQRDTAIARAQEVVDLLRGRGDPQAAWYAHHLQEYRSGGTEPG